MRRHGADGACGVTEQKHGRSGPSRRTQSRRSDGATEQLRAHSDVGVVIEDAALRVDDQPLLLLARLVAVDLVVAGEGADALAVEHALLPLRRAGNRAELPQLGKPG